MKRALATALIVLGISLGAQGSASAGAGALAGLAAPLAETVGDTATAVGGASCCWWDYPIIGAGVAFWELFRDEEFDYHCCNQRWDGYQRDGDQQRYYAPPRCHRSWW